MRNIESGGTAVTQTEIQNVTNEILRALVAAPDERKIAALKALRGEVEATARPVAGPLLMGMGGGAKFLGVSRATLCRVCQAGRLQKVELFPGSYRVRREDLVALAAGEFGDSARKSRRGRPRKHARAHDPRFQQLKAMADGGDENAAGDLFREYGVAVVGATGTGEVAGSEEFALSAGEAVAT